MSAKCECGKPVSGTTICTTCSRRLYKALMGIVSMTPDLEDSIAKQTSRPDVTVSSTFSHPMPINLAAVDIASDLHNVLYAWARTVYPGTMDARSITLAIALYHYKKWPTHPEAYQALDELGFMEDELRRIIDIPPDKVVAGECCGRVMYVRADSPTVTCRICSKQHAVAERRTAMLEELRDRLATAGEISVGLTGFGIAIPGSTVRSWISRGRLLSRGTSSNGRRLYRIGDALDLAATVASQPIRRVK